MSSIKGQVSLGVVGLGMRGALAKHIHKPDRGVTVRHVCDINPQKADEAAASFGATVRFTTKFEELVADESLDAVMVLSPDWLHAQQAMALLRAGRAVFLEKPMAITIDDCDRILGVLSATRGTLYVGHNMRHSPVVVKMKQLLDEGAIGQVQTVWERHFINYGGDAYFKDWHADRRCTTGLLLQKAAHDLDVCHWLCGGYSRRVHAMGRLSVYNRVGDVSECREPWSERWHEKNWPPLKSRNMNAVMDVEDLSLVNAELDNGILVAYQQCHYTPDEMRNFTFIGDRGRLEATRDAEGNAIIRIWNQRSAATRPEGDEQHVIPPGSGGHGGADASMIADFLGYLRGEGPSRCTPLDARMAVAVGYQATMSLRSGGELMNIPPVDATIALAR